MYPKLIAITGQLKGTIFALPEGEVSLGRDAGNSVRLNDPSVSRHHCLIKKEEGCFMITDLESFNGTFVNGVPIKEQHLSHGDQVAIGDTLLLFLLHEAEDPMSLSYVQLDDGALVTRSTVRLHEDDALYLKPERVLTSLPPTARVARDLNALLEISKSLNSARDLETLQSKLLTNVLTAVPAERAAILLVQGGVDDVVAVYGRDRKSEAAQVIRISRTVASQVLNEGVAILSNEVLESETYKRAESLLVDRTRALVCVPLSISGHTSGIIYLDTSDAVTCFDDGHLQLLMGIAGIASVAFENVLQVEWLRGENRRLQEDFNLEHDMVGESASMREVYHLIARAAPANSTVLIRGESGTGKELAARALHYNSPRRDAPFIAINCATLSEPLLESELFGHERGAFTGAFQQKKGKLEIADGGTVFLDEVAEMNDALQAKLLRVLQERKFERVGGNRTLNVDVRVVAATNKDLKAAVNTGSFRSDLYYRLNVITIELPPLRKRREDIPLLATYFVARFGKKCNRRLRGISPEARVCMMTYDWPGNVRELENAIERAVVLGMTDRIQLEDLPESMLESVQLTEGSPVKYYEAVREAKKQLILKAIEQAGGNYAEAARNLGIHPPNLHRIIRNLGLKDTLQQ
jgi:transcriptional regulator with GAF, ATPase, and Fis domain